VGKWFQLIVPTVSRGYADDVDAVVSQRRRHLLVPLSPMRILVIRTVDIDRGVNAVAVKEEVRSGSKVLKEALCLVRQGVTVLVQEPQEIPLELRLAFRQKHLELLVVRSPTTSGFHR